MLHSKQFPNSLPAGVIVSMKIERPIVESRTYFINYKYIIYIYIHIDICIGWVYLCVIDYYTRPKDTLGYCLRGRVIVRTIRRQRCPESKKISYMDPVQ